MGGGPVSPAATLKDESGQSSGTRGTAHVRKALVCAQVMISAVLLIPTGLFLKSLVNLMHVDLGIRTENVIGFSISPELNGYKPAQSHALFERVEARWRPSRACAAWRRPRCRSSRGAVGAAT